METKTPLTWSEAKAVVNQVIFKQTGKYLSDIEITVLQGAWESKTYEQIAQQEGYTSNYLNKDVGNKLWKKLSDTLGETVTKKNFKEALTRIYPKKEDKEPLKPKTDPENVLPFPEGSLSPDSPFYVQRDNIETLCYQTINKPGSLIRIKAPKLMGKTSLINRILAQARHQAYHTVYLDLQSVEVAILSNLDKFLRWLCYQLGKHLNLENKLKDYWDTEILGSNDNCTVYLEEYILPSIDGPLVLALDEVSRIFSYGEVREDFFGMLRSWHEKGKISQIWQKLRLIISHSTEVYIPLNINRSPFNAGLPIELQDFSEQQVQQLAHLHQLTWDNGEISKLMELVGGHPYLVCLALYEANTQKIALNQLLQQASTEAGIYSEHLRRYLEVLPNNTPEAQKLQASLQKVVTSSQPVELEPLITYKLHSMGLIKKQENRVIPRCKLYQQYFSRVLS